MVRHLDGMTMVDDNTSQDGFDIQKKEQIGNSVFKHVFKINTSNFPIPVKSRIF